jgi:hypothetical protein
MRDEKGLIELTMLVEASGSLAPTREHTHQGKVYVEGIDGARYALRVRNLTSARIEVVPSVDGLDVQSGEDASSARRGLVINANSTYDFEGYRLDMTNVATFRFGGVAASYAAQMGKPRNIGVIGVAVFEETPPAPPPPPPVPAAAHVVSRSRSMDYMPDMVRTAPMARAPAPAGFPSPAPAPARPGAPPPPPRATPAPQSLGTSFGERRENKIHSTKFDRATSSPASVISLRYEHRESLRALGIPLDDLDLRETANPFPAEPGPFAKPPPGWKG